MSPGARGSAATSKLSHGDKSIRDAGCNRSIVGAEIRHRCETASRQNRPELVLCPATHHELKIIDVSLTRRNERMLLGDDESPMFRVKLGDTREGQLTTISGHPLSEQRLTCLAFRRRVPFTNIQNEHASRSKRTDEPVKCRLAVAIVNQVVENAAAQDSIVSCNRARQKIADRERNETLRVAKGRPRDLHQFRRHVDTVNDIPSPCQLDAVASRAAPGIEQRRPG